MSDSDPSAEPESFSEEQRKALFLRLVELQDEGLSVPASREACAREFRAGVDLVQAVERQGVSAGWPPLN